MTLEQQLQQARQLKAEKLLSIMDVCMLVGRDRRTLWCWVRDGKFPQPLRTGNKTLGWRVSTYEGWLQSLE
ncbi:helix-turn-helix transcriptional regulator [Photobacterium sagamiensis]|uniref:helix-turn-helix transcriptional regulator n=1 Tax=Photobacterium sagamiensis TaxID=2910241 RepID=UPI003D0F2614